MTEKVLHISRASWLILQRMFIRSLFLLILTVIGFIVLNQLVLSGMEDRFGLVQRYPEFLIMIKAAAVLTFVEMSVFWIRFGTSPKLDVQDMAQWASSDKKAAATVYAVQTGQWLARVLIMLYLMGPMQ